MAYKKDKERLVHFYINIHNLLPNIFKEENVQEKERLFTDEAKGYLINAWNEYIRDIHNGKLEKKTIIKLIEEIPDDKIRIHGLCGKQLDLKLWAIKTSEQKFFSRMTHTFFRKLIEAIDTLLGSLLAASGIGTALEEFKDSMLNVSNNGTQDTNNPLTTTKYPPKLSNERKSRITLTRKNKD